VSVNLVVEVQGFSESDASEAVADCFGVGDSCGLNVQEFDVNDIARLL